MPSASTAESPYRPAGAQTRRNCFDSEASRRAFSFNGGNGMRKTTTAIAVWAAALISASAWAGIAGTPHDLSSRLGTGQVCLPCHAPHKGLDPSAGPVWNHALSNASFTQFGAPRKLTGNSVLCMGCHDGVTAVGNFDIADPAIRISPGLANLTIQNLPGANPANNLGTDLSGLHAVSVPYPTAGASMNPITALGPLRLQNGKVECTTCHDPHNSTVWEVPQDVERGQRDVPHLPRHLGQAARRTMKSSAASGRRLGRPPDRGSASGRVRRPRPRGARRG